MKAFLTILGASALTAALIGCAENAGPIATTNYPYAAYATTSSVSGPSNTIYRTWTTAQLQQRRVELYQTVPRFAKRTGNTQTYTTRYVVHGGFLPQQDEIRAIEGELNRRYHAGDRAAYFDPDAPHVPPVAVQSG